MAGLEIDRELEELIGRDWTVNLTLAEIEQYDADAKRRRGLELVAGLARLCGLQASVRFGELELRHGAITLYEARSPEQAMDWIDGYATALSVLKEKK